MELQTFAQQQHELYGYMSNNDLCNLSQDNWENFEKNFEEHYSNYDHTYNYYHEMGSDQYIPGGSEEQEFFNHNTGIAADQDEDQFPVRPAAAAAEEQEEEEDSTTKSSRPRRRRRTRKTRKNQEEIENQRMAHITVERNRRKQMNDYLAILRRLMPEYYVIKSDQASIIGGAINYVKELEQQLQFLDSTTSSSSSPFSEFFTFPQYYSSTTITDSDGCNNSTAQHEKNMMTVGATEIASMSTAMCSTSTTAPTDYDNCQNQPIFVGREKNRYAAADIEVTMVENHANLKVRSKRRPKQLLKMVCGLQNLKLTVLHLNVVTTVDQFVLYSLSLKVEDECNLASVDDIAAAVNQILSSIQ